MTFQHINMINVNYIASHTRIPMGKLALKNRKIFFEYTPAFIESGLQVSPFKLPLKPGIIACEDSIFEGLFGVFNDSLPDGWGRLLLDRKLMKIGINPNSLTPLDRLRYVGNNGMGALQYEPAIDQDAGIINLNDLDLIYDECLQFQELNDDQFIDDLLIMNGSSGGARPKILVSLLDNKKQLGMPNNNPLTQHNDWIIKFKSSADPKDIGSIEYAYHLMAIEAGLEVPDAKLFKSKKCTGFFGVKRFDRSESQFLHMHTASGLLHTDYRLPSLDYETLMKATLWLTKDVRECEKLFRIAVFNVYTHNRDDHAKNFSFLMNANGEWHIAPAYDLTFSSGPAGEHCTTVMGEGKNPTNAHLKKLAAIGALDENRAIEIIDQVRNATSKWSHFAKIACVSRGSFTLIQKALNQFL